MRHPEPSARAADSATARGIEPRAVAGFVLALSLLVVACGDAGEDADVAEAAVHVLQHGDSACSGAFVAHDLPHETRGSGVTTSVFDGTGAGVGAGDLDGDGRVDLVLANLTGESSVLWNRGGLRFERAPLAVGRFRQVAVVDATGDGALDVVLSTGIGSPLLLDGAAGLEPAPLPGVDAAAYAMAWGDLGGDGDLDLVTGSYNAELTQHRDVSSLLGAGSGVYVHERTAEGFEVQRLARESQALAVRLHDLDGDGRLDIVVGNDLATPDAAWRDDEGRWVPTEPFPATAFSTMSLDAGDLDNDGDLELLATDMQPMSDDPATLEAWEPIFEDMAAQPRPDTVQRMENVLLSPDGGEFANLAPDLGITATGWSWSGLLGDLDNDGFLDAYVVNGMTADSLFPTLPGNELVEENQAFAGPSLRPAPEWGLGDTAGGRGVVQADLDGDGDLDIVVNNLNAPSRLFENQVCGGDAITVAPRWAGSANVSAWGSVVQVTTAETTYIRTVDAARGYLSGGPAIAHFGVGDAVAGDVHIAWPDGAVSVVEDVPAGSHVEIIREDA